MNKRAFIYKRFFQILLVIVGLLALISLVSDEYPLKQRSSATLLISMRPFSSFSDAPKGPDQEKLKVIQGELTQAFYKQLLQDPLLLKKAREKLKLHDASVGPVKSLSLKIKRISEDKVLFTLALKHRKPNLFLNTLIGLYLEEIFESNAKQKRNFLESIHEKLLSLENLILSQEMTLFEMKRSRPSLDRDSSVYSPSQYFRSLKKIEKKLRDMTLNEKMMRLISDGKSLTDSSLSKGLQKFKKWHDELSSLSRKYKSTHPKIKELRRQIAQQENFLKVQKERLERERAAWAEKIGSLRERIPLDLDKDKKAYFSLSTSLESNKRTHSRLQEMVQKIFSEGFFENTDIQILSPPRLSAPGGLTFSFMLKAILVVLIAAFMGVLYMGARRKKQKIEAEYAVRLNIKTLGNFPLSGIKKKQPHHEIHLLLDRQPHHPLCDEIERTSNELFIHARSKNIKSILFTHVGPRSRKIDMVSNLGAALARKNKKVLLIDAAWRQPLLDAIFSLENETGLLNVLLEETRVETVIQTTEIPNLDVLPTGVRLPADFALLSSPAMKAALDEVSRQYDFVLIDAPSCFEEWDIFTLAQYAQGVILVQDSGEKLKPMLGYKSGLTRDDIEGLPWIGKINLNR